MAATMCNLHCIEIHVVLLEAARLKFESPSCFFFEVFTEFTELNTLFTAAVECVRDINLEKKGLKRGK